MLDYARNATLQTAERIMGLCAVIVMMEEVYELSSKIFVNICYLYSGILQQTRSLNLPTASRLGPLELNMDLHKRFVSRVLIPSIAKGVKDAAFVLVCWVSALLILSIITTYREGREGQVSSLKASLDDNMRRVSASLAPYARKYLPFLYTEKPKAIEDWVEEQRAVANFSFAHGHDDLETRLRLRADINRRLERALWIDNSLTTTDVSHHRAFLAFSARLVNDKLANRDWERLYDVAVGFLNAELERTDKISLAETVRCLCLAVVLFDNFGLDISKTSRQSLVTITEEINIQWLRSKCDPQVGPSPILDKEIYNLNVTYGNLYNSFLRPGLPIKPAVKILSVIMPQYETLWRVVLLTFVTAYHSQRDLAHADVVKRTETVPSCLGKPSEEREALTVAMVSSLFCIHHIPPD